MIQMIGRLVEEATNQLNCNRYMCKRVQKVFYDECHVFDRMKSMKRQPIYKLNMLNMLTKKIKRPAQLEPVCHYYSVCDCSKRNKSVWIHIFITLFHISQSIFSVIKFCFKIESLLVSYNFSFFHFFFLFIIVQMKQHNFIFLLISHRYEIMV